MTNALSLSVLDANSALQTVSTIDALIALVGDGSASPLANTLLDRLKTINASVLAGNTALGLIGGYVDGLEGLIGTTNTNISATNSLLSAISGYVDGLEALITTTNTTLIASQARAVSQLGTRTVSQSPAVNIATDQPAIPVNQVTSGYDPVTRITRSANTTIYPAGAVVGGVQSWAVGPAAGSIAITGAQLNILLSAVPAGMTSFRLYLYNVTPPSAIADNAAWTLAAGDQSAYLGYVDIGTPVLPATGSTMLVIEANNINKQVKTGSATIYGYLVTNGGYTPTSAEKYDVTLHTIAL
jgi:hypothetical protein